MNKDKHILITGGAGFIGSNLVDHLVKNGFTNIRVLDNLETGYIQNIQDHIDSEKIEFIRGDITDLSTCESAVKGIDVVLHQAALGSVPRSIENPMNTFHVNVTGFMNMIDAARKAGVKRFVYASSSSVYGSNNDLPKQEDKVGDPLSPYAVSKKTNELFAKVYGELYGMECIGLRYFNVFGPKQNPSGPYAAVIPIFISKMIKGEECNIFGDGSNRRDFTYISNVVQANMCAMQVKEPSAFNRVYNIAFGSTLSVNKLFELIRQGLNSNSKASYKAPRPGEIKDSFADIGRAKDILGYKPEISLEEGIKLSIDWYKEFLGS